MTSQSLLRRVFEHPVLLGLGWGYLNGRVWRIESGAGAGLKLHYPQNFDFVTGVSELPVQREISRRLEPGYVFYDIGANVGFFSVIAARFVGPTGCVCAFEPHPCNARAVRENAQLNQLSNVHVFEVAAGSDLRDDELLTTKWDGGNVLASSLVTSEGTLDRMSVRVVALDRFITDNDLRVPDFVKIDVEGAEIEVIQGMSETLTHYKPIVLYEIDDKERVTFLRRWDELDKVVSSLGYQITRLEPAYPGLAWNVGHSLAFA